MRRTSISSKGERCLTIDARWLVGGIGTYTRHLLHGLSRIRNGFEVHAITLEEHRNEVKEWCSRVTVVNLPIYTMREQFVVPRAAGVCDLLHVPHYNAPLLKKAPLVVSIHDVMHLTDPDYRGRYEAWVYARPVLKMVSKRAAHIITVSEYSKQQIVDRLRVPPSKVSTIYNGVNGDFTGIDRQQANEVVGRVLGHRQPYVLFVGNLKPHKNISCLLGAYALLRQRRAISQRLLILGNDEKRKRLLVEEGSRLGIGEQVDFMPYARQDVLPSIYAAASLFVMPSRIEGFGLPVLEAMSCGTPVVCSNAGSLPEVGGRAVEYFDPASVEELAAAIERVLDSPSRQAEMREKGLKQAAKFSWEESTRKHVEVYSRILQESE